MTRLSIIELFKEGMSFSAGHFTILSATKREKLHGHNYQVYVALTTEVAEQGLTFDYRDYKQKIYDYCRQVNEVFLVPAASDYLHIEAEGEYYKVIFNQEKLYFLQSDVILLPLVNITVEELSNWFLQQLIKDKAELEKNKIQEIVVKVSSSPGQFGSSAWRKENG